MYGWHAGAHEDEVIEWRTVAADFINGKRVDVPLTLDAFRAWKRELSIAKGEPQPCPCDDCIMEHSSHPDEMRLCPHYPGD
jgi:hypothetical protein